MRVRVLLVLLVLSAAHPPAARATETLPAGGPGGNPFSFSCADGQHLIGLTVGMGSWVDQVRPICGAWTPGTHRFENVATGKPIGGSGGQSDLTTRCPRAYTIKSLYVSATRDNDSNAQFVDSIWLYCETIEAPTEAIAIPMESYSVIESGVFEPPRVFRRLHCLREWSHGKSEPVLAGSS